MSPPSPACMPSPKPGQNPPPPVILGGHAKNVLERVVAWGDGWLPNNITPEKLRESRATLDRLAKDAGRNPSAITISVHGQPADRDLIKRLHDAGANRVIVRPTAVKTEGEMSTELTRIAEAGLGREGAAADRSGAFDHQLPGLAGVQRPED